jgi:hypothetical protein
MADQGLLASQIATPGHGSFLASAGAKNSAGPVIYRHGRKAGRIDRGVRGVKPRI